MDDDALLPHGRCRYGVRRTEDRHSGDSQRPGDVHQAGIVRKEESAAGDQGDGLLQVRFPGDVDQGMPGVSRHRGGAFPVAAAAEQNRLRPGVIDQAVDDGGEPLRKPLLRRPVGGARCEADQGASCLDTEFIEELFRHAIVIVPGVQLNAPFRGRTAERPDHLEIVVDLVNLTDRLCPADRMGEKQTPAVGVVTGAKRDAGQPGEDRRLDRILEEDGAVEAVLPEFPGQAELSPDAGMTSRFLKDDDLIHVRRETVDLGDPGFGEDGDPSAGPRLSDGGDGRECHDDIADPVRPPDQHPFDSCPGQLFPSPDRERHAILLLLPSFHILPFLSFPYYLIRKPGKNQLCKWIGRRDLHPDPEKGDLGQEIGEIGEADAVLLRRDDPVCTGLLRRVAGGSRCLHGL